VDWAGLPAADAGALSLLIRRAWIGDHVRTEDICPQPGCGERFDVGFALDPYLAHHRPRRPRGVAGPSDDGWYSLARTNVRFRIPTVEDVMVASVADQPGAALASSCVVPSVVSAAMTRRVDRALSALAPSLEGLVGGNCPSCGTALQLRFDPLAYTLAELRDAFRGVYEEAHLLASTYGWAEERILAMPRSRRSRYVSLIIRDRAPV
jgi:hypothetical protein